MTQYGKLAAVYDWLTPEELTVLHSDLTQLQDCHGAAACWAAGHLTWPFALRRRHHRASLNAKIARS